MLVRRLAGDQGALRPLAALADGYGAVTATVRDLLDAGVDASVGGPLAELLASDGPAVATVEELARAQALVRTAVATARVRQLLALTDSGSVLRQAAAALAHDPGVLPAGPVLVHGFGEATGAATALLAALAEHRDAEVIVDLAVGPAATGNGPALRYTNRLRQAFELAGARAAALATVDGAAVAAVAVVAARSAPPAFVAVDPDAEVRETARRLRLALDAGATAERLLVVARDLTPFRAAIRRHFERLAIPFSDLGASGPAGPESRLATTLAALLGQSLELPAERWLDLLAAGNRELPAVDARLALAVLGAGRVANVAALDLAGRLDRDDTLPLPIRRGPAVMPADGRAAELPGDDDDETAFGLGTEIAGAASTELLAAPPVPTSHGQLSLFGAPAPPPAPAPVTSLTTPTPAAAPPERRAGQRTRRHVPGAVLRELTAAARGLRQLFERWPADAPWRVHARLLDELLTLLGWLPGTVPAVDRVREELAQALPGELPLRRPELGLLLDEMLDELASTPLGGAGSGVQVLTVTEARGRTADAVHVLGLVRGSFPRPVREDALLSDALRRRLRALLPDLPVKGEGHDEERVLFAQLLGAAPAVTLSWSSRDGRGNPQSPSPLLAALGSGDGSAGGPASEQALVHGPLALGAPGPRTASEELARAGLHGSRAQVASLLPTALAESGLTPAAAVALAAVRTRLLAELDPDLRTADGRERRAQPGPFQGFVGSVALPTEPGDDPRRRSLAITTLESLARCPWQVVLRRLLGLTSPPDALGALPAVDGRLLGALVHRVLDGVARRGGARLARDLAAAGSVPVPAAGEGRRWPTGEPLARLVSEAAGDLLREEGRDLPGLATALATAAEPYLALARELDTATPPRILAVEGSGGLARDADGHWTAARETPAQETAAGEAERIVVRADRLDLDDGGLWRLTDWKTGRLPARAAGPPLVQQVRAGGALQAPAYLRAAGRPAVARYVSLDPAFDGDRELATGADAELLASFDATMDVLTTAWRAGQLAPRLADSRGRTPDVCGSCEVKQACWQGDSGARARLLRWLAPAADQATAGGPEDAATAAIRAVWRLAERP